MGKGIQKTPVTTEPGVGEISEPLSSSGQRRSIEVIDLSDRPSWTARGHESLVAPTDRSLGRLGTLSALSERLPVPAEPAPPVQAELSLELPPPGSHEERSEGGDQERPSRSSQSFYIVGEEAEDEDRGVAVVDFFI